MMRAFCEQVDDSLVRFLHEIVDDKQHGFAAVKIVDVRQTLMKRHSRISSKQLLVFAVAVDDFRRRWLYHGVDVVQQTKDESRLAAGRRPDDDGGERMRQR